MMHSEMPCIMYTLLCWLFALHGSGTVLNLCWKEMRWCRVSRWPWFTCWLQLSLHCWSPIVLLMLAYLLFSHGYCMAFYKHWLPVLFLQKCMLKIWRFMVCVLQNKKNPPHMQGIDTTNKLNYSKIHLTTIKTKSPILEDGLFINLVSYHLKMYWWYWSVPGYFHRSARYNCCRNSLQAKWYCTILNYGGDKPAHCQTHYSVLQHGC